jgi:hypothetical protein
MDTIRTIAVTLFIGLVAINLAIFASRHPVHPMVSARQILLKQVVLGAEETIQQANENQQAQAAAQAQAEAAGRDSRYADCAAHNGVWDVTAGREVPRQQGVTTWTQNVGQP